MHGLGRSVWDEVNHRPMPPVEIPPPEPTADTTLLTADSSRVNEGAPDGLRAYFQALNSSLFTEFQRRALA